MEHLNFFDPRGRKNRTRAKAAAALSLLAAAACLFTPASARADWLDDIDGSSTVPFCPLIYGPMCEKSLSVDLALLYQGDVNFNQGNGGYFRWGGDASFVQRLGKGEGGASSPLHLGGGVEIGGQSGSMDSGFHITPRARLRYWPALGPVSIELGSGFVYERIWPKSGEIGHDNVGLSQELSVGVLGFGSVVGGADFVWDPSGARGAEAHFMVGARLSVVTVLYILALGAR